MRVEGSGFRVQGSGFRAQGSGFRVQGSGFRVQDSGFRVQGSGCRAQGSGFRVQGPEFRVQGSHVTPGKAVIPCWEGTLGGGEKAREGGYSREERRRLERRDTCHAQRRTVSPACQGRLPVKCRRGVLPLKHGATTLSFERST